MVQPQRKVAKLSKCVLINPKSPNSTTGMRFSVDNTAGVTSHYTYTKEGVIQISNVYSS